MIAQTSLLSFVMIQDKIGVQEREVYEYIQNNPACWRRLISKELNIPLQSVCGRVNSLVKKNLVFESGTVTDSQYNTTVKCLYHTKKGKKW